MTVRSQRCEVGGSCWTFKTKMMRSTLCFHWPVHLLRDTAAAGAIAWGKQITKRSQIYAHFGHVATDFAALHLGSQGSRYLTQSAPFTLAQEASVSSLTICKTQTHFLRFLTVAPEECTYPIISSTSWPNTGADDDLPKEESVLKNEKFPIGNWKQPVPSPCQPLAPPLWPGFDGWGIAEPNSCSQIRDQETTRQDPGMPGPASCSPALEPWEIRHTFQQILAVLHFEWQVFSQRLKRSITNVKTSCEVKAFNDHSSNWPGREVTSGWPREQKALRLRWNEAKNHSKKWCKNSGMLARKKPH